jgi:hypothetical protein
MAKKQIRIWVETDTLSRIRSGSIATGKSLSDFADTTLRRGLVAEGSPASGPDPEFKALLQARLDEVTTGFRELERAVLDLRGEDGQGSGPPSGYPWTKEQVRHLVYTLARLDKFFTVYNADWGKNDANVGTRARVANEAGDRAVQKYGLGEDDHGR